MSMTNVATPMTDAELDQLSVNTIRTLSIDAVERAKSGHPGTPMALAPLVYTIWNRVMRFDPADPIWPNRDRFVLSNGHASMLLWSVLHLTGTQAVAAGTIDRGVAVCGSGVGAAICANKLPGVRAGLIHDHFSAKQGVEDDHMNVICLGGRTGAVFSDAPRHLRRLGKVALLEREPARTSR